MEDDPNLFENPRVLSLSRGCGPAGTGGPGVALLPAAVSLTGVVSLLLSCRGVVPPLVRPIAIPLPRSLSGQAISRGVSE